MTERHLVEQSLKVDIRAVVRAIRQSQLLGCTLSWVVGAKYFSGVVAVTQRRLLIFIDEQIFSADILWHRPHFGGVSASLVCPSCARAKRTVFVSQDRMQCRDCSGLKYKSQFEHGPARARRRALKIISRLDSCHTSLLAIPGRPPGMHRRTYLRAVLAVANKLQVSNAALHEQFVNLKAISAR